MKLNDYFEGQRKNLEQAFTFEPFVALIPDTHQLYVDAVDLIPKDCPPYIGQFILVGHKSLLSAAALIGQSQPDDAAAISRRVIEAARVLDARHHNPEFAESWNAYEERMGRWEDRMEGKRPKRLNINWPKPTHPHISEMMDTYGMLSDMGAHFSPEYLVSLDWEKRDKSLYLNYFVRDSRTIELEFVIMAGTHMKYLDVVDQCMDGALQKNKAWIERAKEVIEKGQAIGDKFRPEEQQGSDDAR